MSRIEVSVALRHIRMGRRQTVFSLLAVMLTVAVISIFMSFMTGFTEELIANTVENQPHIVVSPKEDERFIYLYSGLIDRMSTTEGITATSARLVVDVALEHQDKASGAMLIGVDPEAEDAVMRVSQDVIEGEFMAIARVGRGVVLGDDLANDLEVNVGDAVKVSSPLVGEVSFTVVGIVDTGTPLDASLAYSSLEVVQDITGTGAVSEVIARVDDVQRADEISSVIEEETSFNAQSWIERNAAIFELINTQMSLVWLFYALIFAISGFGVANTLITVIMEKTGEIGMLMAMGTTPRQIRNLFILESGLLGLTGVILGIIVGYAGSKALAAYEIPIPSEIYLGLTHMPVLIRAENFLFAAVFTLLINLIAGVYPARRAARLNPVEAIVRE